MAKIIAGLTRKKPGQESYSSDGYHLSVEVEAEITTREEFAERVHSLFAEVESALDREIQQRSPQQTYPTSRRDFWGSGGNGGNGHGGNGGHAAPQERDRSHAKAFGGNGGQTQSQPTGAPQGQQQGRNGSAPATPRQVQAIFRMARRAGMKTQAEVAERLVGIIGGSKSVYELTKSEASRVIDALNGKEATST